MVSRFLTPFGGRPQPEQSDAFLELPHELTQMSEGDESGRFLATPRLDVYESDGVVEMTAELPGVPDEDIDVCLEGDILTISGEKRGQGEGKKLHFSERSYGSFRRSIQLPFAPDPQQMQAGMQNGVLIIRFPRVEPERSRRIPLTGQSNVGNSDSRVADRRAIGGGWTDDRAPGEPDELVLSEQQEQRSHGSAG